MTLKNILPPALRPGDMIGVMAPSSYVEKDDIEKSKAALESRGYKVFIHPQTYERHQQSAGTHLQKVLALQGLWQREDIKAVWAAGGGNRALHLLSAINFDALKRHPKILIGFSDVTVLLNAIYARTGIVTFHGSTFRNLHSRKELDDTLTLLAGKMRDLQLGDAKILREGKADGSLVGGNLSLFQYLPQTLPGKFWQGGILFLEDTSEELSRIDRMFLHLKNLGVLGEIKGLVLGQFGPMKDSGRSFGFSLEDIIAEHMDGIDIPIIMQAPFGHQDDLATYPVGARVALDTSTRTLKLQDLPVTA